MNTSKLSKSKSAENNTRDSNMVPHRSTNLAQHQCLTLLQQTGSSAGTVVWSFLSIKGFLNIINHIFTQRFPELPFFLAQTSTNQQKIRENLKHTLNTCFLRIYCLLLVLPWDRYWCIIIPFSSQALCVNITCTLTNSIKTVSAYTAMCHVSTKCWVTLHTSHTILSAPRFYWYWCYSQVRTTTNNNNEFSWVSWSLICTTSELKFICK